jgi:Fe-S-cluster containining protein
MPKPEKKKLNNVSLNVPALSELSRLYGEKKQEYGKILKRLKQRPPKNLDEIFSDLHDEAFEKIDCLECANCCKTTSPILLGKDIERLADFLSMRPAIFAEKYVRTDEDGDYVFRQTPCPFLGEDNYCSVYKARPKACAGYPHTDRKNQAGLFDITLKNAGICPAVFGILSKLSALSNADTL